jgi:hypothetical protein
VTSNLGLARYFVGCNGSQERKDMSENKWLSNLRGDFGNANSVVDDLSDSFTIGEATSKIEAVKLEVQEGIDKKSFCEITIDLEEENPETKVEDIELILHDADLLLKAIDEALADLRKRKAQAETAEAEFEASMNQKYAVDDE